MMYASMTQSAVWKSNRSGPAHEETRQCRAEFACLCIDEDHDEVAAGAEDGSTDVIWLLLKKTIERI
jgi:hypothetical protein